MKKHRNDQEWLVDSLYGEADPEVQRKLEEALESDEDLASEYREMKATIDAMNDARLHQDPGVEFWREVWPEFRRRKAAADIECDRRAAEAEPFSWNWRPALQISIVAVMLVLGIFIGRIITEQQMAPQASPYDSAAEPAPLPFEQEIEAKTQDYFAEETGTSLERSTNLIRNFMDLDPRDSSGQRELISRSRDQSNQLLGDIAVLRAGLDDPRFVNIQPMLDEIELYLGEIASMDGSDEDLWFEIETLQRGISERRLLDRLLQAHSFVVRIRSTGDSGSTIYIDR